MKLAAGGQDAAIRPAHKIRLRLTTRPLDEPPPRPRVFFVLMEDTYGNF